MRIVIAFVAAVVACYLVGAAFTTNHVANNLLAMGVDVPLGLRIQMVLHDWVGLIGLYLPIITVALVLGFVVAWLLLKLPALSELRTVAYVSAGAVALLAIYLLMGLLFEMHPVAATRTTLGLLLQGVAGALGGWLFARLSQPQQGAA